MAWTCPNCKHINIENLFRCDSCGTSAPASTPITAPRPADDFTRYSPRSHSSAAPATERQDYDFSVQRRYHDAYLLARTSNGIGRTIKIIGSIAMALAVFGLLAALSQVKTVDTIIAILTSLAAVLPGLLLYCVGVLISAIGQLLKATLDTAINSSPFLPNDQKAKAMSL